MMHVRRFTVSWIALFTLLVLLVLAMTGCARRRETASHETPTATSAAGGDAFSVYDLDGRWRDQTGTMRSLASLRGAPVLLAMVYTHCTATCPLAVSELKRIAALEPDVRFVLVSLDPARDDPERLARYAADRALDASRWTLLTGPESAVRDLAATLSVRYRRVTPEDLAHSNLITLLDRDGRIVRQTSGPMDAGAIAELTTSAR